MMEIYQGAKAAFPIVKHASNEAWLCQLKLGSIHVAINNEEFDLHATSEAVYFIIFNGVAFKIIDGSCDFSLDVFTVNQDQMSTLYPHLGSNVNAGFFAHRLISSSLMGREINEMLSLDYQQLHLLEGVQSLLERDKMILHLVIHILLTFYNGLGRFESKGSSQSFSIMKRFYTLFDDKDAYCHRDTQYFADRLNITVRYLFQVCKDEVGRTPKNLINEIIVSEIRHTMLTTELSLQQISNHFQFPDQTSFTQFFKRNSGITPTEFRKRYK